ncbi:MAG: hypothetical protein PHW11_08720 [Anaerolineaceae bacterium]|nr:hypothetical protein [Anaerolineaceae bacterium]MDD4042964.1 hypothetical protein [Anaerolineaceae bacterium]
MQLMINLSLVLETLNQILYAGVAITAIALLMYATGFNFRDRIVQTFALILVCVVLIYTGETVAAVSDKPEYIQLWLQLKWIGLMMLPAVYLHFSDTLLTVSGRPSRGRRKTFVWLTYLFTGLAAVLIFFGISIGGLAPEKAPMYYLERNQVTLYFGIFYIVVMAMVSYNLVRAMIRTVTKTGLRRMIYLFLGAAAIAISSIIFLFHGNSWFALHPHWFWFFSILGSLITGFFVVVMTYTVSFFGLLWTDRQIKSRLFRWLLRGPFTVAIVLGLTTIARRYGELQGEAYSFYVPIVMVGGFLLIQYAINIFSPYIEKSFFWGDDRKDLEAIQSLQDRMLTNRDLHQFLETTVALISDRLPVSGGFIALLEGQNVVKTVSAGDQKAIEDIDVSDQFIKQVQENLGEQEGLIEWDGLYLVPLEFAFEDEKSRLLGLGGFVKNDNREVEDEDKEAILQLAERATLAIKDHALQKQVLQSLSALQTEVDYLQNLRAATSFNVEKLKNFQQPELPEGMSTWVKDALTHYWGGPKLTNNPLMQFKVVEEKSGNQDGNRTNALRTVLTEAIEMTKPSGERKFTSEWLLYNILELKFLQGKKVRDVARKLAVSEADLYRKQKIAIEGIAQKIADMEANANGNGDHAETANEPEEKTS